MPRQLARVPDIFREAQTYLHLRTEHLGLNRQLEKHKTAIKGWLRKNGTEDDDGNLVYQFPRELQAADGKDYAGVMLKRQLGPQFLVEDEVRAFLESKYDPYDKVPLHTRVFKMVEVMDPDELYVLQQEGKITEAELRKLLHDPDPTYALWPVESADILEEE